MRVLPSYKKLFAQAGSSAAPRHAAQGSATGRVGRWFAAFFILLIALLPISQNGWQHASAAHDSGFSAMQVIASGGGQLRMAPGEQRRFTIGLLNTGEKAWVREGGAFVSVYTYGPKYRTSTFEDASWERTEQPARLDEGRVGPGEVGHVSFTLRAPNTSGYYEETFHLAAEDTAWIPGGEFTVKVQVGDSAVSQAPTLSAPTATTPSAPADNGLAATLLLRSERQVTARGGQEITYTIGVKNTGTKSWLNREVRTSDVALASVDPEDTHHSSWLSSTKLVSKSDAPVAPGALDFLTFTFKAPPTQGSHTVRYMFAADGNIVPDFAIDIPVEVTSNAPEAYRSPLRTDAPDYQTVDRIDEPTLRVGVLIVDEETDWQVEVSCESSWKLRNGNGELLGEMQSGEMARAFYKDGKYWFNRGKGLESTSYHIRFIPDRENSICTVENFDRRVTRDFTHPDNTFRNILEIRHNGYKDRTWLINELPMEYYLRGLAETSNISHEEFQKALITVARTYALYHWERGTKRGKEFFTITAYADDQVYNGYGQEQRAPRITEAVKDTEGLVVTHNGKTAITPYFSRSDGRTRDWGEVWYGDVEWLKSVPTPCDEGKTLWGHGVGLSASAALCQANNGKKWNDILKYFYQGIDISRRW